MCCSLDVQPRAAAGLADAVPNKPVQALPVAEIPDRSQKKRRSLDGGAMECEMKLFDKTAS
jgi:hypothetical protein